MNYGETSASTSSISRYSRAIEYLQRHEREIEWIIAIGGLVGLGLFFKRLPIVGP